MATAAEVRALGNGTAAEQKFPRLVPTGMVVGSMVDAGIFSLPDTSSLHLHDHATIDLVVAHPTKYTVDVF
jgi:hypothetical protein